MDLIINKLDLFTAYRRKPSHDMSEGPDVNIQVVYEGGVFKLLQEVDLRKGTKAFVVLRPGRITSVARRYRIKVDRDAMSEFVEGRR